MRGSMPVVGQALVACVFAGALLLSESLLAGEKSPLNRLRPLDSRSELDSGQALGRACVPGETVVMRENVGKDSSYWRGLHRGQFVVCTGNSRNGELLVADGPGRVWQLSRTQVNATRFFPAEWTAYDRDYLVWAYDRNTLIFRESLANSFEGNFFYLLLDDDGEGRLNGALLIDSGTGYANLRPYIAPLIGSSPLTVVNTHSHWDHFGGNRDLQSLPNVRFYGYQPDGHYEPFPQYPRYSVDALFDGEEESVHSELAIGKRRVTALKIPGHTEDSIALYDAREQLLFTSDTVCPCLLFIEDWSAYLQSTALLKRFVAENPVKWLLGGHLEMSRPKADNRQHEYFYFGSNSHRDEHALQLPLSYLALAEREVKRVLADADDQGPRYDARRIDKPFHDVPMVPVPFPGIPSYYRDDANRLVDILRQRHASDERCYERCAICWHCHVDTRRRRVAYCEHKCIIRT